MGSVVKKVTGALGLTADERAGQGQVQQANALQKRAVRELEKLGVPSIEAQRIVLEEPELVLSTLEDRLGPSAFEDITVDPRLQEAELDALSALQQAGEEGFTAEDKARQEALRSQIARDEQARQASILQQMAQRGALDSGAQLAAQLGSSQAATQRASEEAIQMAGQQASARRNALAQAANLAGQMGQRQFGQQAQQAQARDAIQQFNAAVSARDTAARQQQAQQRAQLANQQEMYNKGLIQQNFQNQLAKATGMTGALNNQAQQAMQAGAMQANAAQQNAAGTRGLLIGGAQAAVMSDKNVKENVKTPKSEDIHEMLDKAQPKQYTYTDPSYGQGQQVGVMAQDLEKSKEGDKYVMETPEGKAVDYGKMGSTLAAGLSDVHKRLKKLEGKDYQDGGLGEQQSPDRLGKGDFLGSEDISDEQTQLEAQVKAALYQQMLEKAAKKEGEDFAAGGMKGMNYEAGGEGTVIDSGMESFAGDDLPDRINDGEMVLNLDQQDRMTSLLKELAERRRADEMVNNGEAIVNEDQQETLMNIARGEAEPEDLDSGENVVESLGGLESLLNEYKCGGVKDKYQDGGIEGPLDLNNIVESLANFAKPEPQMTLADQVQPNMTPIEEPDYSEMMTVGEPEPTEVMALGNKDAQNPVKQVEGAVESKQVEKTNDIVESANKPKKDDELESARRKDMIVNVLGMVDKALSHYDAGNPNAVLKPVQRELLKSNLEEKLLQARQMASNQDYKKRQLDIQEEGLDLRKAGQEAAAEERQLRRDERAAEKGANRERKQRDQDRRFSNDIYKVRKDFLADPVVKELRKQDVSFDQAESLLQAMDNDNKVAVGALGTKMARAMGEVGVLTDADVIRYIQRMDVSGRAQDYFSRNFKGKVSDMTQKDLEDITNIMRMGATKRIGRLREDYVDAAYENFGKQYDMSRDEVSKRLGATSSKKPKDVKPKEVKESKSETPKELRRKTKDGRIAVFDENKKFLRYEE